MQLLGLALVAGFVLLVLVLFALDLLAVVDGGLLALKKKRRNERPLSRWRVVNSKLHGALVVGATAAILVTVVADGLADPMKAFLVWTGQLHLLAQLGFNLAIAYLGFGIVLVVATLAGNQLGLDIQGLLIRVIPSSKRIDRDAQALLRYRYEN